MCTGGEIALLAASAAGTMMQQQAAEDANNQRQAILNAADAENAKLNEQRAKTIESFADTTYRPEDRVARYENAATKQESSLAQALMDANGGKASGDVSSSAYGNLSSDFTRAKADATAKAADDIMKRARLSARTGAAGMMYDQEALMGGDMASEVAGIGSKIARNDRYARTALSGVQDSGSLAGGLLQGLSSASSIMGKK
jgi:hypothetical protein